jgi:hypothetical protein
MELRNHNPGSRGRRGVRRLDIALVLWPSFLAACLASVPFFAAVDPDLLRDAGPHLFAHFDRKAGYAIGFFFFWAIGALASTLSVYLIRSSRRAGRGAAERGSTLP